MNHFEMKTFCIYAANSSILTMLFVISVETLLADPPKLVARQFELRFCDIAVGGVLSGSDGRFKFDMLFSLIGGGSGLLQ